MFDFFEFSNEMLCVADSRGYFTRVNRAWTKTLGWSAEEMTARPYFEFLHPDDLEVTRREAQLLLSGTHETIFFENRYITRDGSYRWLSWQATYAPDTQELIAAARDVTEQKRQAEALRMSEARFRQLATSGPVGIVEADAQGRCTFVNRRWCEMAGISEQQALGEGWKVAAHPDDREGVAREWYKAVREGREFTGESRFLRPDGKVVWVHFCSIAVPNDDGTPRSYISTVVDITDLKNAYDALKAEQELLRNLIEVQENEKQNLCHEVHDGVIQYAVGAVLMLEEYKHAHPGEGTEFIDKVLQTLRKGIEDGRRTIRGIRPAVLDDSGLKASIDDLIDQFSGSGILITSKCDPNLGRLPKSIETMVYRVVQEALNNARKHSGTDVVRVELKKSGGDLRLDIRDFGQGFEVRSAYKRGFGLLGMTERVRLLGGECTIESEPDVGTCVSVRLPIPAVEQNGALQATQT